MSGRVITMTCRGCGTTRIFRYSFGTLAWCTEASLTTAAREGWRSQPDNRCPACAKRDDYQLPEIIAAGRRRAKRG